MPRARRAGQHLDRGRACRGRHHCDCRTPAVAALTTGPKTVLTAHTQLEREGLVASRPGLGTFSAGDIRGSLAPAVQRQLRRALDAWIRNAVSAGLDREGMLALINLAIDENK